MGAFNNPIPLPLDAWQQRNQWQALDPSAFFSGVGASGGGGGTPGYGYGGGMTNGIPQQNWFSGVAGPTKNTLNPASWDVRPNLNAQMVGQWASKYGSGGGVGGTGYGVGGAPSQSQLPSAATGLSMAGAGGASQPGGYGYPGGVAPTAGGGGNQLLMDYFAQQQGAVDKANAANEARYQQGLGLYDKREADAMGTLSQFSNQDKADVNRRADQAAAKTQQSAISRGLGNTTVVDALQRGVEEDRGAELRRVSDANLTRKLGVQLPVQKDKIDFIERRTDQAPDPGLMAQIAMKAGEGGYGVGAGAPAAAGYGSIQSGVAAQKVPAGWDPEQYASASANPWDSTGKPAGWIPGTVAGTSQKAATTWTLPAGAYRTGGMGSYASFAGQAMPTSAGQARQLGWRW